MTAKHIVAPELIWREHVSLSQVRLEMHTAKVRVELCNVGQATVKIRRGNFRFRELLVQCLFSRDNPLAERHGLSVHLVKDRLGGPALRLGELQLLRQIKHVPRTRIMIELSGFGEPHALAGKQCSNISRIRLDSACKKRQHHPPHHDKSSDFHGALASFADSLNRVPQEETQMKMTLPGFIALLLHSALVCAQTPSPDMKTVIADLQRGGYVIVEAFGKEWV
jgi:hypothetical protein